MLVLSVILAVAIFTMVMVFTVKKRVPKTVAIVYLPSAFVVFVLTIWMVVWTPWLREFRLQIDDNPLRRGGEQVTKHIQVPFWERAYWMSGSHAKEYLRERANQHEKSARLIKFTDPRSHGEVVGIDTVTVFRAFGEPVKTSASDGYTVLTYAPWEDHRDWTLHVYLRDGKLVAVGESNLP
ncbi:MAG: hypothetical protein Q7T01_01320 [bacterium]|nr:hypothetical protein [bacterium]